MGEGCRLTTRYKGHGTQRRAAGYVVRIVAPSGKQARILLGSVRPARSDHLEGPLGAACEAPECRLMVRAGTPASATEWRAD